MRASAVLGLGLAALATSSPIETRDASGNTFEITNFVYGCTVTCDWSFDVTVTGSSANHPPVTKPVHCEGSVDTNTTFVACDSISSTRSLSAYITKKNQLRLDYHVEKPNKGAYYDYFGHRHVNAATSGKPQPSKFTVKESRATGVA